MLYVQGDRLQDLVKQLQAAIHPAEGPSVLKQLAQQELTQPMTHPLNGSETNLKQLKGAVDQTQLLLPLIPGTQQESSDSD